MGLNHDGTPLGVSMSWMCHLYYVEGWELGQRLLNTHGTLIGWEVNRLHLNQIGGHKGCVRACFSFTFIVCDSIAVICYFVITILAQVCKRKKRRNMLYFWEVGYDLL